MAREKFKDVFRKRIDEIEREAHTLGLTMTEICRRIKRPDGKAISRATPDRWREKPPKTVQIVDEMEEVLEKARRARPRG